MFLVIAFFHFNQNQNPQWSTTKHVHVTSNDLHQRAPAFILLNQTCQLSEKLWYFGSCNLAQLFPSFSKADRCGGEMFVREMGVKCGRNPNSGRRIRRTMRKWNTRNTTENKVNRRIWQWICCCRFSVIQNVTNPNSFLKLFGSDKDKWKRQMDLFQPPSTSIIVALFFISQKTNHYTDKIFPYLFITDPNMKLLLTPITDIWSILSQSISENILLSSFWQTSGLTVDLGQLLGFTAGSSGQVQNVAASEITG